MIEAMLNLLITPAYAADAPAKSGVPMDLILIGVMFAVMYFLMIRPQQKKAKELRAMIDALKKGDEVVTTGGLLGKVAEVGETFITVKLAENVQVNIQRNAVSSLMPKGTIKSAK